MCNNALIYNAPETIYYKAAKKMVQIGAKMMAEVCVWMGNLLQLPSSALFTNWLNLLLQGSFQT